jgi:shikimate dehydrogenase
MTYAVFGQPIAHSRSPRIHRAFAAQRDQDIDYKALELSPADCPQGILDFFARGGQGANVTLPHKQCVYQWLAEQGTLTETARRAKAVNTIFKTEAGIGGDNTDGQGFLQHLRAYLHWPLAGSLLIIGAGGACRGLLAAFSQDKDLDFKKIYLTNRTDTTAEALALEFADALPIATLPWADFQAESQGSAVLPVLSAIIHTTSLGHDGVFSFTLPKNLLTTETWAYDLSYGQAAASFIAWAKQQSLEKVSDGLGMLVYQAAAAFARWHGWYPEAAAVLTTLEQESA